MLGSDCGVAVNVGCARVLRVVIDLLLVFLDFYETPVLFQADFHPVSFC